ncbi:MAG: 4Fe-4S binding protein [Bacteroidales bacterium]|nr:4Fe-4S binding protein [Bacteroidales bacterium]
MAYVISDDCMACGTCIGECPVGAISEGADKYSIDPEACVECGTCAEACPAGAISLGE